MNYALLITAAPTDSRAQARALAFARALLARGHCLVQVFFYQQAAAVAQFPDACADWQALRESSGCELVLCSASAEAAGIDAPDAGFTIAGLGAWIEAGVSADRVMGFA